MLHLPSYSRGGERIQQKATISGHLQRESLLNENRKARPCHTLHTSAARICTPEGVKSATHAQRRNSCRSGACPNVQIPHPCRLRRRQRPPKKLAIITARPESGLVRDALQNALPASRTQQRPRRQKANDEIAPNAPTPPGPPNMLLSLEKTTGPGQGAGPWGPQPPPLGRLFPMTRGL